MQKGYFPILFNFCIFNITKSRCFFYDKIKKKLIKDGINIFEIIYLKNIMFDGYSLKNCLPSNTVIIKKPLESNEHHYSLGRKQWQQTYTTTSKMYYTEKDLSKNIANLDNKIYLFPNHSNFEIGYMGNKGTFQSTNKNDFIPAGMTEKEKENFQKNYIPKSNDILNTNNGSVYSITMNAPSKQHCNYDYDKINFKYDNYITDTITQERKLKDPNSCWSYEYYNRDKNKGRVDAPMTEEGTNHILFKKKRNKKNKIARKQVWDPIANRFFECTEEQ